MPEVAEVTEKIHNGETKYRRRTEKSIFFFVFFVRLRFLRSSVVNLLRYLRHLQTRNANQQYSTNTYIPACRSPDRRARATHRSRPIACSPQPFPASGRAS